MSRARHKEKMRADGGRLSSEPKWNAGGEQNAAKEAEEKKKGGRVKHEAEGEPAKKRADHKKRARGGRIGADKMPLSSAARVKHVTKGEEPEEGGPEGSKVSNP